MSTRDLTPSPPMSATFSGATVVQLVAGDAGRPGAMVAPLHPATVVLTDRRVTATEGDIEWSWLLGDLEAVHHSPDGPWSILAVPGIADHGVALQPGDAAEFRRQLDALRSGDAPTVEPPPAAAPQPEPASRVEPDETVRVDLDVLAEHIDLPNWQESAEVTIPPVGAASGAAPVDVVAPVQPWAPPEDEAPPRLVRPRRFRPRTPRGRRAAATAPSPGGSRALAGLEARSISAWFGDHNVLDRVSLDMPRRRR